MQSHQGLPLGQALSEVSWHATGLLNREQLVKLLNEVRPNHLIALRLVHSSRQVLGERQLEDVVATVHR